MYLYTVPLADVYLLPFEGLVGSAIIKTHFDI